ncbi:MAG: tetratricopeptide repeat protein [Armatimonadetes bacterium]|nr:tetratricopeptide repeat protein [Armatimonadota bacterium]MDE2205653.1 tetratricopeptide repeat protein [Armatimonadota bacterium]
MRASATVAAVVAVWACSAGFANAQKPPPAVPPALSPAMRRAGALLQTALTLQKQNHNSEAISAWQKFQVAAVAAHLPPAQLAGSWQNLAILYSKTADTTHELDALSHLVQLEPANPAILVELANLDSGQHRTDEAATLAEKALKLHPAPGVAAAAHFILGVNFVNHKNLAAAAPQFAAAEHLAPDNPRAQLDYAAILDAAGKYAEALVHAEKASALSHGSLQAELLVAGIQYHQKDFNGALKVYDGIVKQDPRNANAMFNRALILQRLGRVQEAITAYINVLEVAPNLDAAHLNMGQLYSAIGNGAAARQQFLLVYKHNKAPKVAAGLADAEAQDAFSLHDPAQRAAELASAERHFQAALAASPNDLSINVDLADLDEKMLRYNDAIAIYRKLLTQKPGDYDLYSHIARVYGMQRNVDQVAATWHEYSQLKPNDPNGYAEPAGALEAAGRFAAAADEWRALLKHQPQSGSVMVSLAKDELKLKQTAAATAQLHQVLQLDPSGATAPTPAMRGQVAAAVQAEQLDALRGLANIHHDAGDTEGELKWLRELKKRDMAMANANHIAVNTEAWDGIAAIYLKQKNLAMAAQQYEQLAAKAPGMAEPWEHLAAIYEQQNLIDKSAAAWQSAAARSVDPLPDAMKAGDLYQRKNQLPKALAVYEALTPKYGKDPRLNSVLAQLYELVGRDADAVTTYDRLLKQNPQAYWAEDRRAVALMRLGRYPQAQAAFETELNRIPEQDQTYAELALLYAKQGKQDQYLAWLKARLTQFPDRRTAMQAIVNAYAARKDENAGWSWLSAFAKQHDSNQKVLLAWAQLLDSQNRPEQALAVYQEIAARNPADLNAQTELADRLDEAKQTSAADLVYTTLIANTTLTPDERDSVRALLAQRYVRQARYALALQVYQTVLKDRPNDLSTLGQMAEIYVLQGQTGSALPIYRQIAADAGADRVTQAMAHFRIGDIEQKLGDNSEAITQYKQALMLNPELTPAEQALNSLVHQP